MVWHSHSSLKQHITNLWKGSYNVVGFLQVAFYILLDIHWSYKKCYFGLALSGKSSQPIRCFKIQKLKKDMMYQVNFLLPLKLEEISCYFRLWRQNTLGQSVCRIFYFWLVWLVKLNIGDPLLHCTCCYCFCCCCYWKHPLM